MNLYTPMPLELVLDGWSRGPGPLVDVTAGGITMRVQPVAPGIGKIERIISAPLEYYLLQAYAPGQMVCYAPANADTEPATVRTNADSPPDPYLLPY